MTARYARYLSHSLVCFTLAIVLALSLVLTLGPVRVYAEAPKKSQASKAKKAVGVATKETSATQTSRDVAVPNPSKPSAIERTLASAQNTEVTRLSREGRHLESLVIFQQIEPSLRQLATQLVAAKSAWALGLVSYARELWNELELQDKPSGEERARFLLSHAVMEFQEREYSRATELAEKAITEMEGDAATSSQFGDLKAQCWLVIAESYSRLAKLGDAREFYEKAIAAGARDTANEARLQFARVMLEMGDRSKARETLQGIGLDFHGAAEAIEVLEDLELADKNYLAAEKWSSEGLRRFMPYFHDDVRIYKRVVILNNLNRRKDAEKELASLKEQYAEDNAYYIMGRALLAKENLLSYFDPVFEQSLRKELVREPLITPLGADLASRTDLPKETVIKASKVKGTTAKSTRTRLKKGKKNG